MKFLFSVFILLCFTNLLPAQNKKIIKVLDSNLYLLEDSIYIKLAGIDIPSRNNQNELLKEIADEVYEYTYNNFLNHPLEIIFVDEANDFFNSKLVIIKKRYLLSKRNYNEYFLERGFGKYINNTEAINDSSFTAAEKIARENNTGIWKFENVENFGTLDKTKSITKIDSLNTELLLAPFKYDRSFARILIEIPAGLLGGIACGYIGGLIGSTLNKNEKFFSSETYLGIFTGYVLGNSLGVFLIAQGGNKDLSFPGTILSSLLATAISGGIIAMNDNNDAAVNYFISLAPAIGAIIYANTLGYSPPQYEENNNTSLYNPTHYQFYNHTSLKMNLFRINF